MTFFDWLILSLLKLAALVTAIVALGGASAAAFILLLRDCVGK